MYKLVKYNKNQTLDFHFKQLQKDINFTRLSVDTTFQEDHLENLDFLKDYKFLKGLSVVTYSDINFDGLKYLESLENLHLFIHLNKTPIDLSFMQNLKEVNLHWNKKIIGLDKCKKVRKLQVWHFKHPNLEPFLGFENLEILDLRTSSVKSLDGIHKLKNLKELIIGNSSRLVSIQEIEKLQHLEILDLETCSKIEDYEKIKSLPNLREFRIYNCKKVTTLKFLIGSIYMQRFNVGGNTEVIDGNFQFLKDFTEIKSVFVKRKKHYLF